MKKCGDCANYIGMGDWDLCCELKHEGYPMGFLCYENTEACEKFKPKLTPVPELSKGE